MKIKLSAFAAIAAFAFTIGASAQDIIGVGVPTGGTRNDSYPCAGWGFSAPAGGSTTVNALGFWDATGSGLQTSHIVALYAYNGSGYNLLASVNVPAGTVAPLISGYRWVGIPTVTLPDIGQGGNYYLCVATQGNDTWTTGIGGSPVLNSFFGTISEGAGDGGQAAGSSTLTSTFGNGSPGDGCYGGPNLGYFTPSLIPPPTLVTNIQPTTVSASVGETVAFTVAFSNSPPPSVQWQFIANGVTVDVNNGVVNVTNNGVVSSTLTLSSVQPTNSGSYQLQATSGGSSGYSSEAQLTVIAPIAWLQMGTFKDDTILALAGAVTNEVYGEDFGAGDQTTANGYTFQDYNDLGNAGNVAIVSGNVGVGTYNNYLGGGGTSGDSALDAMLDNGIYNNNGGGIILLNLQNLKAGLTYNILAMLADTRGTNIDPQDGPQNAGVGFYGADGEFVSNRQPFVFPGGTPALGAYALGTFTAVSTNENISLVTEFSDGSFGNYGNCQYQLFLLTTSTPPVLPPIYLAQDTTPSLAVTPENHPVVFSAAFRNIPTLNLQWQVISTNGVTNNVSGPGVLVVNVTNSDSSIVTSTLTISNKQLSASGFSYLLKAVNAADSSQVGYSTPVADTVKPAITWVSEGIFTNDSVLALAGTPANEVYGVDFVASSGNSQSGPITTANGYSFTDDNGGNGNLMVNGPSFYNGWLSGGGTTGDANLDSILTCGAYGNQTVTGALNNLTAGQTYNVLALLVDTRPASDSGGSPSGFTITDGVTTSPQQPYMFQGGTPYVGGYILGTFTAAATNQTYTIICNPEAGSTEYNLILVEAVPPTLAQPTFSNNNVILTGTGAPNSSYTLLTAASLLTPLASWTTAVSGTMSATGTFSNAIPISASQPASFFILKTQMP